MESKRNNELCSDILRGHLRAALFLYAKTRR
nr:MAG TPA: hypothetical protein [Caudoviricetes sp.]